MHWDKVQAFKPNCFGQTIRFELPSCILEYQVTLQKWLKVPLHFRDKKYMIEIQRLKTGISIALFLRLIRPYLYPYIFRKLFWKESLLKTKIFNQKKV
jgi:hypothetical protein